MPFRPPAVRAAILVFLLLLIAGPGRAASFVDSAERHVTLPDRPIRRVMPANQAAAVLIYVLAPNKLVGWSEPLRRAQHTFIPRKYARRPVIGRLTGPDPSASAERVMRLHPDLIIDTGAPTPQAAARADRIQRETGIPYIIVDGSVENTPHMLRTIGAMLGVSARGEDLASYTEHAITALRGRLLIRLPTERRRVYYGLGPDGMETGLAGSAATADIDQAGSINVAAALGHGELTRIMPAQLHSWNPRIVLAQRLPFYRRLLHARYWRDMRSVRNKWVYLVPDTPFGWLNDPPGVNRIVGLYWLPVLFYPTIVQEDLPTVVRDFYDKFYRVKLTDKQLAALIRTAESRPGETSRPSSAPLLGAPPLPMPSLPPLPKLAPSSPPPGRGGLPNLPKP